VDHASDIRRAAFYRNKAIELRAAAEGMNVDNAQKTLTRLADTYDVLAKNLEDRVEGTGIKKPPFT
jgi:hypothetical protein